LSVDGKERNGPRKSLEPPSPTEVLNPLWQRPIKILRL
jgi:hypothetical protein